MEHCHNSDVRFIFYKTDFMPENKYIIKTDGFCNLVEKSNTTSTFKKEMNFNVRQSVFKFLEKWMESIVQSLIFCITN